MTVLHHVRQAVMYEQNIPSLHSSLPLPFLIHYYAKQHVPGWLK